MLPPDNAAPIAATAACSASRPAPPSPNNAFICGLLFSSCVAASATANVAALPNACANARSFCVCCKLNVFLTVWFAFAVSRDKPAVLSVPFC